MILNEVLDVKERRLRKMSQDEAKTETGGEIFSLRDFNAQSN